MSKKNLPSKICPVCKRPFTWRKKWERDREHVMYCSKRCRRSRMDVAGVSTDISLDEIHDAIRESRERF